MPECYFYSRFNACHNKECPFLHIDPEAKVSIWQILSSFLWPISQVRDCPWYDRGFCRHGPNCRHRHVRRVLCINYLAGFCPVGDKCPDAHPRWVTQIISPNNFTVSLNNFTVSQNIFYSDSSCLRLQIKILNLAGPTPSPVIIVEKLDTRYEENFLLIFLFNSMIL